MKSINNLTKTKLLLILFFCIGVSLISCGQSSLDSKRRNTMISFINAIKINDTLKISSLVDTTNFFKIYGKENYYYSIQKLNKKFSKNQILTIVNRDSFKIDDQKSFGTTYKLLLYTSVDNKNYYEVSIRFFADSFDKINSFTSYFHDENPEPLIPAPTTSKQ